MPDPVALAFRVFEPAVLARRLDYLRLMEWFPREGAPVVVQGSEALVAHAESIAAALTEAVAGRNVPILLLETEPADGDSFIEALMPRLHGAFRVPASTSLVDILAVFSGARCFMGDSVHGNMAAFGFGVPSLFLSPGAIAPALAALGDAVPASAHPADAGNALSRLLGLTRADGLPSSVADRLETHFDALADFAGRAQAERIERDAKARSRTGIALSRSLQDAELRLDATRTAWEARSEQVAALRLELAERLESLESRLGVTTQERDRLAAELQASGQEAASLRAHLASSQAERERLESDLVSASKETASLRSQLQTAEESAASLRNQLHEAGESADSLRNQLQAAEEKADSLHSQLQAALAEVRRLIEAEADASRRIAERDAQLAQRNGELEAIRAEFVRFVNLRLFRYTALPRRLYASLRRALGRMGG